MLVRAAEQHLDAALEREHDDEADDELQYLPDEGSFYVEIREFRVDKMGYEHTYRSADQGCGVIRCGGYVMGIEIDVRRDDLNDDKKDQGKHGKRAENDVIRVFVAFCVFERGIEQNHENASDDERDADVKRSMHSEIHS